MRWGPDGVPTRTDTNGNRWRGRWRWQWARRACRRRRGLHAGPEGPPGQDPAQDRGLLQPVQVPGRGRAGGHPQHEPHRPDQPAAARPPDRPGDRRPGLREPQPLRRPDDRPADHHRPDRRRPELPQQRHRPERHAGPARRPVLPPPVDAAPLLHRNPHGRDPEPPGQRRRGCPGGHHRHRQLGHQQPGRRDQHDHRDVPARLAPRAPVPGHGPVLPVPHLPRRARSGARSPPRPRSPWPR